MHNKKGGKGKRSSVGKKNLGKGKVKGKGKEGKGGKSTVEPAEEGTPIDKPIKKTKAAKTKVPIDQAAEVQETPVKPPQIKKYINVQTNHAGRVIGKKGVMLKHIKKVTGASIKVLDKGSDENVKKVIITAPDVSSVEKAFFMVSQICESKEDLSSWTQEDLQTAFDKSNAPAPQPKKLITPTKVSIPYIMPKEASNLDVEQALLSDLHQNGLLNTKQFRLDKAGAVISLVVGRKSQVDSLCEDVWQVWGEELMTIYAGLEGKVSFDLNAFNQRHPRVLERKEAAYLSKGYQGHRTDDHAMFVASFPLSVIEKGDAVNGKGKGCNLEGEKLRVSQQILSDSLGLPPKPIYKGKLYVNDEPRAMLKSHCPNMFTHDGSEEDVYVLIIGYDDGKSLLNNKELLKVKEDLDSLDTAMDTQVNHHRDSKAMLRDEHLKELGQMGTNRLALRHSKEKNVFEVTADKSSSFYSSNNKKSNELRDEYAIDVPGGKRDLGDCLLMASLRELLEEVGCQMKLCNTSSLGASDEVSKSLLHDWFGLADKRHLMTDYQQQIFDAPEAVREVEYIGGGYNQVFLIRENSNSSRAAAQHGQIHDVASSHAVAADVEKREAMVGEKSPSEDTDDEEEIMLVPVRTSGSVSGQVITHDDIKDNDTMSSLGSCDASLSSSEPTPTSVLDPWSCDLTMLPPTERFTTPVAQTKVDEIVELWERLCEKGAVSRGKITHAMKKVAPVGFKNAFVKRIIENLEADSRVTSGSNGHFTTAI